MAELVALGSLAMLKEVQPYRNPSDARLPKFAQLSEILMLFRALSVEMAVSTDEELFAVLVVALLVPIVFAVGAAVRDVRVALRTLRPSQRRRAPTGPVRMVAQTSAALPLPSIDPKTRPNRLRIKPIQAQDHAQVNFVSTYDESP